MDKPTKEKIQTLQSYMCHAFGDRYSIIACMKALAASDSMADAVKYLIRSKQYHI
ncbi:hypothetical protein [Xanthomonas phage BUDD]|nr:hypothetical protein [Xanthomonas phage BUDD]